jgi:hypothetical protein
MALANAEVVERFVLHQEGKGKHLRSDGETLWSYRTPIAIWTSLGLVSNVSWYSVTTAIHQSILWDKCGWDFYPWDDLENVPLEEMAKAEGVAVASKRTRPGHLFFRIAGEKCEYVYCSNHRLVEHLDQRRFLSGLEVSALLEYARRRGWERRRIGEALLSGDRAKLLAALLLGEKMRFDGEKFRFLCPHCGAECDSIEVKTVDTFFCHSFETSEEHIEVDHWPEADPVVLFVCPECGEELDGKDIEKGVERWLGRLRKSKRKYAKWLSENILEENERARNLLPLLRQEVRPAPPRGQGLLEGCPGCPGEAGKTVLRQAPLPVDHREAQAPRGAETPENPMGEGQSAHAGIPPFGGTCPTGASATCR